MVSKNLILGVKSLLIFVILCILCTSQIVIAADTYYKCSDGKYFNLTFSRDQVADLVFYGSNKVEKLRFEGARTYSNEIFSYHMDGGGGSSTLAYIRKGKVIKEVDCEEIDKSSYPHGKVATQAAIAGEPSPCQGVTQTNGANIKNKAELERVITKQLKNSLPKNRLEKLKVTLLRAYALDNWTIILVNLCVPGDSYVYLFYSGNPLTNRYVAKTEAASEWGDDMKELVEWVLKNATGIPPKLANCWAWSVTHHE